MVFLNEVAAPAGVAGILGSPIFMFVIIIAIMYFMMIRPQRKRQKEIDNFRRGLQPGVEGVTYYPIPRTFMLGVNLTF